MDNSSRVERMHPEYHMPDTDPTPMRWDEQHTQEPLTISNDGRTLFWVSDTRRSGEKYDPAWLGAQSSAWLSNGIFAWDFKIESLARSQIGVGFLLDPPDWGFYGYLGAGKNAWAYDAFDGAIVTETRAIHAGLPTIWEYGTVAVHLDLTKNHEYVFAVNGVDTPPIPLPRAAVIIPAACLLKKGQVVTLANFERLE